MSEQQRIQISLHDCKHVSKHLKDGWDQNPLAAVINVITAYNEFVTGDAIGVVRANPDGDEIAISCGPRQWWLFNETSPGDCRRIAKDPVVPTWPVVHSPKDT